MPRDQVVRVGEHDLPDSRTRPDYAVLVRGALVGFIETKAPRKWTAPRDFTNAHDRKQWVKLQPLPNPVYTAITRAREQAVLMGDRKTFARAVTSTAHAPAR